MVENLAAQIDESGIDVTAARRATPTCLGQSFLDNAGAALPTAAALEAVIAHLRLESEVGGYVAAMDAAEQIANAVAATAALVGTTSSHIALQGSATEAWTRAFGSIPLRPGDRILTTRAEYASNVLAMLQAVDRYGVSLEFIPDGPDGTADPGAMAAMVDERVRVLAVTHAPSQNGMLVDAAAMGAALRSTGSDAWYLLDACQSVGQMPLDMADLGCDFLASTGRKFLRAPRGTGFLAISDRALGSLEPVPPEMHGSQWDGELGYHSEPDASSFQFFEMSYAGVLGLGSAAAYALAVGLDAIRARIDWLAQSLRTTLADTDGVRVLDRGTDRTGIVVFACRGEDPGALVRGLRELSVTVSGVNPGANPRDFASYHSTCVLRASVHIYNTEDDLAALLAALRTLGAAG